LEFCLSDCGATRRVGDGNPNRDESQRDTRHTFDVMDAKAVAEAEKRFEELTGRGFTAAIRTTSGEAALTRSFDPTAEETLFIPRLVGG
jgi:hypothetical protein